MNIQKRILLVALVVVAVALPLSLLPRRGQKYSCVWLPAQEMRAKSDVVFLGKLTKITEIPPLQHNDGIASPFTGTSLWQRVINWKGSTDGSELLDYSSYDHGFYHLGSWYVVFASRDFRGHLTIDECSTRQFPMSVWDMLLQGWGRATGPIGLAFMISPYVVAGLLVLVITKIFIAPTRLFFHRQPPQTKV